MAQKPSFHVRLLLPSLDAISGLHVDNECMPLRRREDGQIEMEAIVNEATLNRLRQRAKHKVAVEVLRDLNAEAKATSKLFSRTNRYADGSLPTGPGTRNALSAKPKNRRG